MSARDDMSRSSTQTEGAGRASAAVSPETEHVTFAEPILGLRTPTGFGRFTHGVATHAGLVRDLNEDRYFLAPERGIYAVADGMGGHAAGDVASSTVVECLSTIGTAVTPTDLLARIEDRILRAHETIRQIGLERGQVIGTTLAALLVFERDFACLWAGDSRLYQLRGGKLEQLSRDHTEAQVLVDSGALTPEEARTWPRRNIVTRAVGIRPDPELELLSGVLEFGDTFMLCSDGLTAHLDAEEISASISCDDPQAACEAMIALTLERGGSDNVTVLVVRFEPGADTFAASKSTRSVAGRPEDLS